MNLDLNLLSAALAGLGAAALLILVVRLVAKKSRVLRSLSFPLYVGALAVGLKIFTVIQPRPVEGLDRVLTGTLLFLAAVAVLRLLGALFFDAYLGASRGVRLPPLLPRVIMGATYLITAILILKYIKPDLEMAGLVATSAVTSLVLGLALQPILGNFFAGLVISLERPFRINDWIKVQDIEGRVAEITWRTTHLRTRDNDNLVIPNSQIANQEILNYFYPHPLHLERIYVGAHYRTPPYRVKQAILDAAGGVAGVLEKPSPEVYLYSFDDSAITYEARVWIEDIAHKPRIASEIKSEIWQKFHRRGITIPFPIRTLELEPRARTLEITRPAPTATESGEPLPARLYVAQGTDRGAAITLEGTEVTIGRDQECDLTIREPRASGKHLEIGWSPETGYWLKDLDSTNGTQVNNQMAVELALHNLDRITIGDTVIVFETHAS